MVDVPSSSVSKNFGEWHDKALVEPVVVTKHGRPSIVMISVETFERVLLHYTEIVDVDELDEFVSNSVVSDEIPEDYQWDADDPERGPFGHTER